MTEPASHAGFRDLARQALSRRTGIPAKTDWEVFLHGFASTNQLGGEKERDIYECLLRTFPTPESVLEQDLRTLRNEEGCQNLISPVSSAAWMKENAENWENIAPLLRCRTRAEQDAIRNFTDDPQNQNKRLKNQVKGAGYKGSDMTLLWGGCEVPVVDKQLVRYLAPHMLGKDWDSYIREQLSERKDRRQRLRIGRRFAAELGENIEAEDIDVDDPNHRYAEEEAIVGKIQSTVGRYGAWRDLAYQMADTEGIPANIWHVATWLEYRIGGDPDSPRANPRTLARGREFAERTYAPSETPSDYDRETTPTIYHGTIFDFTPEEIRSGTRGEGIWLASNRQAAEKITRFGQSILAPEDAKRMDGARVFGYRIKPEARIHTIPYWDGVAYEPLIEAMVKEGADVLEIVRTKDILARGNRASYYLVQNPDILEPVSATEAGLGTEGFHEVSFWNPPSETPGAVTDEMLYHLNHNIEDLTSYGTRNETVERGRGTAFKFHWSNASEQWYVLGQVRVGEEVFLDANEFIGYGKKADLEEAAPQLDPLPLYYSGPRGGSFEYKQQNYPRQDPGVFVGFEGPFGFDDDITKQSKDWIQYQIGSTPVVVRRTGTKAGLKLNPRYKGAGQPQQLLLEFQLKASTRRDMEKINFLLERLREDNPTMAVNVDVKTNGQVAHRRLPTWEERPYRLAPAMFIGYQSPDEYDSNIQSFNWEYTEPHPEMEDHALISTRSGPQYMVETQEIGAMLGLTSANPFGFDEEEKERYRRDYFNQPHETNAYYEIDGVRVQVKYGKYTLGHNAIDAAVEMRTVDNAGVISIQRVGGTKADVNTFRMIGRFLDRIKEENPGIRLFAEAKGDPVTIPDNMLDAIDPDETMSADEYADALSEAEEAAMKRAADIRARVYTRYGWERLYELAGEDLGGWSMEYKPAAPARVSTAFTGIDQYANDIMELV